jgi:Flp pilus assembly protein TadD
VHKRKLDEAEADYRALEELDPDDKSLRTRLAGTLALRAKLSLIKNKNGAAIADATAAVEIMPDDASVRMVLADAFFQMGKLDQAIEEYKKVLDQQPQNKRAQKRLLLAQSQRPAPKKKKGKGK